MEGYIQDALKEFDNSFVAVGEDRFGYLKDNEIKPSHVRDFLWYALEDTYQQGRREGMEEIIAHIATEQPEQYLKGDK